jgi:hypothetical protein
MGKISWMPDRKVWSGGLAALLTFVIGYAASRFGYPLDAQVLAILPVVFGYAVSYLVPASVRDIITKLDNEIVALAQADPDSPVTTPVVTQGEAVAVVVGKQIPGAGGETMPLAEGLAKPGGSAKTAAHIWPLIVLLPLVMALAGCSQQIERLSAAAGAAQTIATAEVRNPVTLAMVYDLRAAHVAAQRLALAYRRIGVCPVEVSASLARPCASRAVLTRIIALDRAARKAVDALELYVRAHPTLDATDLYAAAKRAVTALQAETPAAA